MVLLFWSQLTQVVLEKKAIKMNVIYVFIAFIILVSNASYVNSKSS